MDLITFEELSASNLEAVLKIQHDDVSEAFVDTTDTIIELTQYGRDHPCKGHTYAIKQADAYIGWILLGEVFAWDTAPKK